MSEPVTMLDGRVTLGVSIYALCDGRTLEPRYAGKTNGTINRRLTEHLTASRKSKLPVGRWIQKQLRQGIRPHIRLLEVVPFDADWAAREAVRIAEIPAHRRLNLTTGGEGLAGHRFAGTEHARKIAATKRTGATFACEQCGAAFWRKQFAIKQGNCRFCSRDCYAKSLLGRSRPISPLCKERGLAAAAKLKRDQTHCKRGHPLSGDNLYQSPSGPRVCKECRKGHKLTYRVAANG